MKKMFSRSMKNAWFFAVFAAAAAPLAVSAAPRFNGGTPRVMNQNTSASATPSFSVFQAGRGFRTGTVQGANSVRAEFWRDSDPNGEQGAVYVYTSYRSGSYASGNVPMLPAGEWNMRFRAWDAAGTEAVSDTYRFTLVDDTTNASALNETRRPVWGTDGAFWKAWGDKGEQTGAAGSWTGTKVRMASSAYVRLDATTTRSTPAQQSQLEMTDETVMASVGSIWFKARATSTDVSPTLVVGYHTGSGRSLRRNPIQTIQVPQKVSVSDDTWTQYQLVVQGDVGGRLNFRNATEVGSDEEAEDCQIQITDIVIAPPVSDVAIERFDADFEPGYPSVEDPIVFRVKVRDLFPAFPAAAVSPKLVWRQNGGAWNVTGMTNVLGKTVQTIASDSETGEAVGEFAATLAEHSPGSFEYFFRADFAGYVPTFEAVNPAIASEVATIRFNSPGDHVLFDKPEAESASKIVRVVDAAGAEDGVGREFDFDPNAVARLSRSPAFSWDLREWQSEFGGIVDGAYVSRNEDDGEFPLVVQWDLSHRFDVPNLYGGWLRTYGFVSDEVTIEDNYPYSTLHAADGVRRFRSRYKTLSLSIADHAEAAAPSGLEPTYPMQQVGDYVWQSIIRVTNAVDVAVSVKGEWEYDEETGELDDYDYAWGERGQDATAINPPMAGSLTRVGPYDVAPEDWAPVRTQIEYDGFLMMRFCTTNGSYQIRRAAWQDFNAWQADDEMFSRSFGLSNTKTFENDLESAPTTAETDANIPGLDGVSPSARMVTRPTFSSGLLAQNFWFTSDRFREDPRGMSASDPRNMAWRLSASDVVPGSLETTILSRGDGRGTLKMKVRAATDDDRAILYTGADAAATWTNKRFVGKFSGVTASAMSDSFPSYSVYGYWQDANNYWEARLTQTNVLNTATSAAAAQTSGLVLELFVKENGAKRSVGTRSVWLGGANASLARAGDTLLVLDLSTASSGAVTPRAYVLYNANFARNNLTSEPARASGNNNSLGIAPSAVTTTVDNGTVGYNMRDVEATLVPYVYEWDGTATSANSTTAEIVKANGSANTANVAVSVSDSSAWTASSHDGSVVYQGESPWDVTKPSASQLPAAPATLKRARHSANYRVLVYRPGIETATETFAPVPFGDEDWDDSWDVVHDHAGDGVKSVSSFAWTQVEIPMHFWDDAYVRIEGVGDGSTADVAIDDVQITGWTGQTTYVEDYGDATVNEYDSWIGAYSTIEELVVGSTTNRYYTLDRTRVDPSKDQSITSPLLQNGVGDLYFSYKVASGTVRFVVERIGEDGGVETFLDETVSAPDGAEGDWVPVYVPVLDRAGGRFRVRTLRLIDSASGEEVFGCLQVDSLRATDYPYDAGTAWESYNVLVSTFRSTPSIHTNILAHDALVMKFDGPANPADYRSAVLNDGTSRDTIQDNVFDEHQPFVQTPSISTGVGEVSFWYRRSPDTHSPAKVHLLVATAASPVDSDWKELTVDDLNPDSDTYDEQRAALEALSAVETYDWTYFTAEFFQQDYKVLRIVGETNGANRVMIDNILVTEPVRSSIDIGTIVFDPEIPVVSGDVGVKVTLANPRMQPQNIQVTLEYFVGTNRWGYANWKDNSRKGTITFTNTVTTLSDGSTRVNQYEFASVERIPHNRIDDVVQYCAVATYEGTFASPVYSATQERSDNTFWFQNPEWYEPTDLNKAFGTADSPVAHYWVFSCTTNVVRFNELKYTTTGDGNDQSEQFIEIMGPQGASLAGWTIEHFGQNIAGVISEDVVKWTNTIPAGAVFKAPNNGEDGNPKGWGFWTLGASAIYPAQADQLLFPAEEQAKPYSDVNHGFMDNQGAIRLRRSMGAVVDKVAWARRANNISSFLDAGYTQLPSTTARRNGVYLSLNSDGEASWESGTPANRTIGGYNYLEEEYIDYAPGVDGDEPDEPDPAMVAQPQITSFAFVDDSTVEIEFSVAVTNGIALAADGGWAWSVLEASDLDDPDGWTPVRRATFSGDITAAADGTPSLFTVRVPVSSAATARFYKIKATLAE